MELYCSLMLDLGYFCTGYVGGFDAWPPGYAEPFLGYHAEVTGVLTCDVIHYRDSVWWAV